MKEWLQVDPLPRLGDRLGIEISVVRDDLYPFPGGGNKARKVASVLAGAKAQPIDALVTVGGVRSNQARVVALAAARRGWPCTLVLHGDGAAARSARGNLRLAQLSGARIVIVAPDEIEAAVKGAMNALRDAGRQPLEIPGGRFSATGALAFTAAVEQMAAASPARLPDWILLASGTGTTQAGILAGVQKAGWTSRTIGISVSRPNPRGADAVAGGYRVLADRENLPSSAEVEFHDDWVGGGYEAATEDVYAAIRFAAETEGLILDPTYTGKAFHGLREMVASGDIAAGSSGIFWHTGGLLNLLESDVMSPVAVP